ncbi:MAG: phytanoyl-CoA dioxygenase family protein [Gemmatimonadetes bacterium]|nr:phytanoyl-CoA dioxygenase family protein [Gemmatimonadota bacterium]MBT5055305.1 phytanoyl-CoA dioxygenase family protein [Gemmatimonadota bacterium]MBT5142825.1 phytanoyl-CoA dioxygenase family protein [Gemmatimonadota bacterium]MBT5589418.1 phytanoyl-CoA dioxygenase family protein [Gemmatimonadota bacterium]MBT5960041.1 phytanoyl-CoA dioxygenase family protein [Gemmatimonadota bacterium]
MSLTPAQIDEFYDQGFIILRQVFDAQDIAAMSAACERLKSLAQDLDGSVLHQGANFAVDQIEVDGTQVARIRRVSWCGGAEPVMLEYGADPRLLSVAAALLDSDEMNQLINQLHYKEPGDTVQFPLHQDSHHRGYGTPRWEDVNGHGSFVQTATLIDPMTPDNGPLLFIPGSNQQGHLGLPTSQDEWPEGIDLSGAVTVTGDPGDVAFFGPYTLHGSRPNTSTVSRRVFINGYAYPGANRHPYVGDGAGRLLCTRPTERT